MLCLSCVVHGPIYGRFMGLYREKLVYIKTHKTAIKMMLGWGFTHAVSQPDTNTTATPSHMRHVHKYYCVYIWQANQKQRSVLDPHNYDSLFSYFWEVQLSGVSAKWVESLLLSIKSVNLKVSAVWCLTIIGTWKLTTRLIHFLHYRVEDSF